MNFRQNAVLSGLAILLSTSAQAQLTFPETDAALALKAIEDTATAVFPFENGTSHEIKIEEVKTSCGCLLAATDKTSYGPGEKGEVKATFKVGSATGQVQKYVNIATSTGGTKHPTQRLTVRVEVPEVIKIEPAMLDWDAGSEPETKKFTYTVDMKDPVKIRSVKCSRDNFDFEVKPIEVGRKYEITLTPRTTESPLLGILTIETDSPIPKLQKKLAFFSIKRARPKRAVPAAAN